MIKLLAILGLIAVTSCSRLPVGNNPMKNMIRHHDGIPKQKQVVKENNGDMWIIVRRYKQVKDNGEILLSSKHLVRVERPSKSPQEVLENFEW